MRSPLLLLVAVSFLAACATSKPGPPAEFSLARAKVVAADSAAPLVLEGAPGKGAAAAAGAAGGAAVVLTSGGLACLATGPFIPVCLAVMAPVAAVTAAGTAAVGAIMADTSEDTQAKRDLLRAAMAPATAHGRLAQRVRELARARQADNGSADVTAAPVRDWNLLVTVSGFDTVGTGADKPYALRVSANLELHRSGSDKPSFARIYQASSETKYTIAEWGANEGERVRSALEGLLNKIASDMVADLDRQKDS